MLRVHSIETFGTHDGPGIRMVVFLQGCMMRCVYCHNPDTQAIDTDTCHEYSTEQVIEMLEKQRPYFGKKGGLTVSGGEPTLQAEGLIELFTAARERGIHTALDTNGAIWTESVRALYDITDLVILDVKHINDALHKKLTKIGNENVLKNATYRENSGKPLWLRYVLVPGWTDQPEYLEEWAQHFQSYRTLERVEILPYHTFGVHKYQALGMPYALEDVPMPTSEQVQRAYDIFHKYLPQTIVV